MAERAGAAPRGAVRWFGFGMLFVAAAVVAAVEAVPWRYGRYLNVDEGYAAALASRLLDGAGLYTGAVSQRGPLMYYLYEGFAALSGWDSVSAIRAWSTLFSLAVVILAFVAVRRSARETVAGFASLGTAYVLAVGLGAADGLALNGEMLQAPFVLVGLLLGETAQNRFEGRSRCLLLGAVALGAATCVKQSAITMSLPLLATACVRSLGGRLDWRDRCRDVGAVLAGAAALPALFVGAAVSDGRLERLLYFCISFNLKVHGQARALDPADGRTLIDRFGLSACFAVMVTTLVLLVMTEACGLTGRRRDDRRQQNYWLCAFLAAYLPALAMPQAFGHYFVVAVPLAFIALALRVDQWGLVSRPHVVKWAASAITALVVAAACRCVRKEVASHGNISHDDGPLAAARYVERTTAERSRIFVWGFSPWVYGYAHRRPAGRFLFATYVTGFVPWFWGDRDLEPQRVVPGSVDELLSDLRREEPEVVVDAGSVRIGRSMRGYEPFLAYLDDEFCFEARVNAFDVYRRRGSAPCLQPSRPCTAPLVDYEGASVIHPIVGALDDVGCRALPSAGSANPVAFVADPTRGVERAFAR